MSLTLSDEILKTAFDEKGNIHPSLQEHWKSELDVDIPRLPSQAISTLTMDSDEAVDVILEHYSSHNPYVMLSFLKNDERANFPYTIRLEHLERILEFENALMTPHALQIDDTADIITHAQRLYTIGEVHSRIVRSIRGLFNPGKEIGYGDCEFASLSCMLSGLHHGYRGSALATYFGDGDSQFPPHAYMVVPFVCNDTLGVLVLDPTSQQLRDERLKPLPNNRIQLVFGDSWDYTVHEQKHAQVVHKNIYPHGLVDWNGIIAGRESSQEKRIKYPATNIPDFLKQAWDNMYTHTSEKKECRDVGLIHGMID
ncbi:MAG: hypothetical protein ACMXYE_01975 [Candidatus Woesearchaeota archaeon]